VLELKDRLKLTADQEAKMRQFPTALGDPGLEVIRDSRAVDLEEALQIPTRGALDRSPPQRSRADEIEEPGGGGDRRHCYFATRTGHGASLTIDCAVLPMVRSKMRLWP